MWSFTAGLSAVRNIEYEEKKIKNNVPDVFYDRVDVMETKTILRTK